MERIIECVPNYSEGRNKEIIDQIVAAVADTKVVTERGEESVKVLDVDPGEATNRTVVTFVGSPEAVLEAAFQGEKKAAELIDMRHHHGAHPRSGATDVLPLVPVAGITLEECGELARGLAKRIYNELGIPCYCYEAAAYKPERKNLAVCRAGEYEALPEKVIDPERKPDFGPEAYTETVAKAGASNVGARDFLIAVNFNLNTTSTRRAMAVAFDVREKGRPAREGGSLTGKIIKDEAGKTVWIPGTLKGCKAIGWFIEEYGIAQVSMNITDMNVTPLHVAFEEVCRTAAARGLRVTGTEIVGLVPKRVLVDAGKFYLEKQQRSLGGPQLGNSLPQLRCHLPGQYRFLQLRFGVMKRIVNHFLIQVNLLQGQNAKLPFHPRQVSRPFLIPVKRAVGFPVCLQQAALNGKKKPLPVPGVLLPALAKSLIGQSDVCTVFFDEHFPGTMPHIASSNLFIFCVEKIGGPRMRNPKICGPHIQPEIRQSVA